MIVSTIKNTWNSMVNWLAENKVVFYTILVIASIILVLPFIK